PALPSLHIFFCLTDPPPPDTYTLSLHDALPIYHRQHLAQVVAEQLGAQLRLAGAHPVDVAHERVDLAVVGDHPVGVRQLPAGERDRKSTRLNSSHDQISYAVFCLKKKKEKKNNE